MSASSAKKPDRTREETAPVGRGDKAQTEVLRQRLGQKLKDPALAKKAAQIIEEMLKKIRSES